jgi:Fe-S-cluster containining protein
MTKGRAVAHDEPGEPGLPAGDFSTWLVRMRAAIEGNAGVDVPCAGCTACCTSYQFIHIEPDEAETLARIPAALLAPAPGLPAGHMVLGYDDRGHCPMLIDNQCSIYSHRPRTCRAYDCRVFAATGIGVEPRQEQIARRARRWHFDFPGHSDRIEYEAVRAAAVFVDRHRDALPGTGLVTPTRLAATAVAVSAAFVERDGHAVPVRVVEPDADQVRNELMASGGD